MNKVQRLHDGENTSRDRLLPADSCADFCDINLALARDEIPSPFLTFARSGSKAWSPRSSHASILLSTSRHP